MIFKDFVNHGSHKTLYEMVVKTTSWIYLKSGGIFKDFVSWGSHKALRDGGKLTGPSHPPVKINTSQPIYNLLFFKDQSF